MEEFLNNTEAKKLAYEIAADFMKIISENIFLIAYNSRVEVHECEDEHCYYTELKAESSHFYPNVVLDCLQAVSKHMNESSNDEKDIRTCRSLGDNDIVHRDGGMVFEAVVYYNKN